jgi:hypothetical protein
LASRLRTTLWTAHRSDLSREAESTYTQTPGLVYNNLGMLLVVTALKKTIEIQKEIDKLYPKGEKRLIEFER